MSLLGLGFATTSEDICKNITIIDQAVYSYNASIKATEEVEISHVASNKNFAYKLSTHEIWCSNQWNLMWNTSL